jgi:hypothetical protein
MRLIRPTLFAIRSYQCMNYTAWFRRVASDPLLEDYCARVLARPDWRTAQSNAIYDVCCALTVFGIDLADLTPEAFLFFAQQCRDDTASVAGSSCGNGDLAQVSHERSFSIRTITCDHKNGWTSVPSGGAARRQHHRLPLGALGIGSVIEPTWS